MAKETALEIVKHMEAKALELHRGALKEKGSEPEIVTLTQGEKRFEGLEVAAGYLREEATWVREAYGITLEELPWVKEN